MDKLPKTSAELWEEYKDLLPTHFQPVHDRSNIRTIVQPILEKFSGELFLIHAENQDRDEAIMRKYVFVKKFLWIVLWVGVIDIGMKLYPYFESW